MTDIRDDQWNGSGGCTKCEQSGESLKSSTEGEFDGGWIYKFNKKDPKGPLRTEKKYLEDLNKAILTKTIINGIKGRCCLSLLTYFLQILVRKQY